MKKGNIIGLTGQGNIVEWSGGQLLEQVLREEFEGVIERVLNLEIDEYIEPCKGLVGPDGRRLVRRSGTLPERELYTGLGPIRIKQPRVRDGREGHKFTSAILPPYLKRTPSLEALIPALYLRGISTGDMSDALQAILGPNAKGLSASNVVRLKEDWKKDHAVWEKRDLSDKHYVYWWVDAIYVNVRHNSQGKERSCILVVMGATADGKKELIAIQDGERESKLSWEALMMDLKRRGLTEGPRVAVGDGSLGFWAALAEQFPECREQRCWVHKTANILNRMPKSVQRGAKKLLNEIIMAPKKADAMKAYDDFVKMYDARYPKAVECLTKDKDVLFTFFDFPAEHWRHLRTTNPIESTFATVRLRTRRTKGCGSRPATIAMVFQLARMAEKGWRRLNGHQLLTEVITGVEFVDGNRKRKVA